MRTPSLRVLGVTLALLSGLGTAQVTPAWALDDGQALTPPMGFNDWNAFGCNVSAALIEQTADIFVTKGLKDAGYQYLNIDDCWMAPNRDSGGHLVADPVKFPDGIKAVADYVHARGLKLGIYESAGATTCQRFPGSLGHETTDAQDFADWGVDYLKYDNCGDKGDYPNTQAGYIARYKAMGDALKATGRDIVYSVCEWGNFGPADWAGSLSHLWRTTPDIFDTYRSMVSNLQSNMTLAAKAGPGGWNDPDMLEVGNGGMTGTEYRSHFSLWAMEAAPLLIGTDLRKATDDTLSILGNKDVIAVDQDPLGRQATVLSSTDQHYVFAKPLANGDVAVALFNNTAVPAALSTGAAAAGLTAGSPAYLVKDLWSKRTTETAGTIAAVVPPHATVMYRVSVPHGAQLAEALKAEPLTTLGVTSGIATIAPGATADTTVTLTNYGRTPAIAARLRLTAPGTWSVTGSDGPPRTLPTGQSATTTFHATAPGTATKPIADAELTGTAAYQTVAGSEQKSGPLELTVAAPVSTEYRTANTTGGSPIFGQNSDDVAIRAAGRGVMAPNAQGGGVIVIGGPGFPGADEYAAVYRQGAVGTSATVQTTVSAQGGSGPFNPGQAGLMIRNDASAAQDKLPGVVLYVSGNRTVSMAWNASGATTVDTSTGPGEGGQVSGYPVHLKLVRNGSTYSGYYSTDDSTWTLVKTVTVNSAAAGSAQDAGLFHSSADPSTPTEADFTGLTIS